VARRDDSEIRILIFCSGKSIQDTGLSLEPRIPEPCRDLTIGADRALLDGEVEIGKPVADGARASEGNHDELVGSVGRNEAGCIGLEGAATLLGADIVW
jgi:hypothetical protein